jgi:N-acyl-L-homoserine lactone synthetase
MAGCVEFGLAMGLRKILSICEPWRVARNEKLGWTLRTLGPSQSVNGLVCVAVEKCVSESIWIGMCLKESVPGSVLFWRGTTRPAYRLPELVPAVA